MENEPRLNRSRKVLLKVGEVAFTSLIVLGATNLYEKASGEDLSDVLELSAATAAGLSRLAERSNLPNLNSQSRDNAGMDGN